MILNTYSPLPNILGFTSDIQITESQFCFYERRIVRNNDERSQAIT